MIGEKLRVSIFGQSHGEAIGVVIDGLPAGEEIDAQELQAFLDRRAPGKNKFSTARKEGDVPQFLSGVLDGKTCGAPLCAVIHNTDTRSGDYKPLSQLMRPSHADYPAHVRYGGHQDVRGGGHFSGRLTAPVCIAGGIAKQILARRGIFVGAHAEAVGRTKDRRFGTVELLKEELFLPLSRAIPVLDEGAAEAMQNEIEAARMQGDSVGGIIECAAIGVPAGLGDPMFGGVENRLSSALFGIPAIRGVEFGTGFAAAAMRGSVHNDPYRLRDGKVVTETNHHGGILGGITSGMPVIFRVAVKPTPSIALEQRTVDIEKMEETTLRVTGRHDPCITLRAVPCVEAVAAIVLLDLML
jgi:chorismate synthase